ncbi:DUF423 domain-containing protein [Costertonia aggregata]|uniref:DUF423 domain-containing protein n=1 Tax=Costertonia aggregata TaxID=343403 RepID=A0A7H9AQG3_9FLAO|nr:DUF423 domain-containing protein [Costertonia aggregata]QLG45680.1 DUF423 domain-containing protein [Costertonia aggregata]
MNRTIFITGLIFGVLAVVLGAFGAHGLEKLVDVNAVATFETGVRYQMYHALFLLVLASVKQIPELGKKWVFYCTVVGVLLFSFSIYLLALNSLTSFDFRSVAFLTPIGGTLLIIGWIVLAYRAIKDFH